jgi:alpha-1,2-glucosyltransferase
MAHPFLLSDNRHYTFYVWKNLFRRWSCFRYALLPLYLLAGCVMQGAWSSAQSRSRLFQAAYWLVVGMVLVPTPLLELRYFLTPFLVWFLHAAPTLCSSVPRSLAAIALYGAINAATLAVFLYRPFAWNDGSQARFMW